MLHPDLKQSLTREFEILGPTRVENGLRAFNTPWARGDSNKCFLAHASNNGKVGFRTFLRNALILWWSKKARRSNIIECFDSFYLDKYLYNLAQEWLENHPPRLLRTRAIRWDRGKIIPIKVPA